MTTQAKESNEQVKFLTPTTNPEFAGRRIPPATLATIEAEGETVAAIWLGGFGQSHNDEGAEFVAIRAVPKSVDDLVAIAFALALAASVDAEVMVATTRKLRDAGFTFFNLVEGAEGKTLVA